MPTGVWCAHARLLIATGTRRANRKTGTVPHERLLNDFVYEHQYRIVETPAEKPLCLLVASACLGALKPVLRRQDIPRWIRKRGYCSQGLP